MNYIPDCHLLRHEGRLPLSRRRRRPKEGLGCFAGNTYRDAGTALLLAAALEQLLLLVGDGGDDDGPVQEVDVDVVTADDFTSLDSPLSSV